MSIPRRMWSLFEPIHAVTYFAPQPGVAFEEAGLRGFWRRYFAGRSAPLGPVGPGPVIAAFFGFAPGMVARALPDVWTRITPEAALEVRLAGARSGLAALAGTPEPSEVADKTTGAASKISAQLDEAADLLEAAARAIDRPGRVLASANADLPWPGDTLGRLWHAATILREHRGDGHVASLLTAGIDGCESLVLRNAVEDGRLRVTMQQARGWTDDEWQATAERLQARGWLDPDGRVTAAGSRAYAQVEAQTDRLAQAPWERLGAQATERCAELLEPVAARILPHIPDDNPLPLRTKTG
jgi:hypothetical protein